MFRLAATLALSLLATPAPAVELVGRLGPVDQHQLIAVAREADANWNARNAAGLAAMYTQDATLLVPGKGPVLTGPEDVRNYFTASFARTPGSIRHTTQVDRLVVLAADRIQADTREVLDKVKADGSAVRLREFNTVTVLVRRGDEWKYQSVRVYPVASTSVASAAGD